MAGWDTLRLKRYISYFTSIPFESWAFDLTGDEKKQIEEQQPLYRIVVQKRAGGNVGLSIWERLKDENGVRNKDTDRVWGKIDGKDNLIILRYFDIDPILKRKSFFFGD